MANCYTAKHKRPRTQYHQTFVQWTEQVSKWRRVKSPGLYRPHYPLWPLPPIKRFRPMQPPEVKPEEEEPRRVKVHEPRGLKTPEQSFAVGYKHFHTDPSVKKLLHLDAETELPYTLNTEFRDQYQNPNRLPHLNYKLNTERYGLPKPRLPAIGGAPRTVSIPFVNIHLEDDPSWKRDCNTQP